jgi:hypothetical protein
MGKAGSAGPVAKTGFACAGTRNDTANSVPASAATVESSRVPDRKALCEEITCESDLMAFSSAPIRRQAP